MQVVAAPRVRRPFVADQRREATWLVVFLREVVVALPRGLRKPRVHDEFRQFLLGLGRNEFHHRGLRIRSALRHQIVPALERRVRHHFRVAVADHRDRAHPVRMIGDRDPVERSREAHGLAAGGDDFLATRETQRVLGAERRATHAGIARPARVHVLVAEERALRVTPSGVWRIPGDLVKLRRVGRRRVRIRTHDDFLLRIGHEGEAKGRGNADELALLHAVPLNFSTCHPGPGRDRGTPDDFSWNPHMQVRAARLTA